MSSPRWWALIAVAATVVAFIALRAGGSPSPESATASKLRPTPLPTTECNELTSGLGLSLGAAALDRDETALARDLDLARAAGVNWVRIDVDWSRIELAPGDFDWERTDRAIALARARDMDVVALLGYSPNWARPEGTSDKAPPFDPAAFGEIARVAAQRYEPQGVHTWEIWNEPNSDVFWKPDPDPDEYVRLARAAADAIRLVDPAATILSGGLAPGEDRADETEYSPEGFLAAIYDAGGGDIFDAIAVHPYSYPARPTDDTTAAWNTFIRLPILHGVMLANGDQDKPIWITEYGAPTGSADVAISEADQAGDIVAAVTQAAKWPWVERFFVYNLRDRPDANDPEQNFGLLRVDDSEKPAYQALVSTAERCGTTDTDR